MDRVDQTDERIKQLKKEIKESKRKLRQHLEALYDLGLAPYRGYYEELLGIPDEYAFAIRKTKF